MEDSKKINRRDAIANILVGAALLPGVATVGYYAYRFLVPSKSGRTEELLLEKLSNIPVGSSRVYKGVLGNDLILLRLEKDNVKAFSSICTHLGCRVQWDATAGDFLCPCHMGRFDANGEVTAGPPPSPLPAYPVKIEDGKIYVVVPVKEV
jgi:Rieske Fe-S protein